MPLVLYNTVSREKEEFRPLEKGRVKLYVCGPTVYDHSHIGHARCYVTFDVLVRLLKEIGYQVTYVRNFTDLDDKIINRANEQGVNFLDLAEQFIKSFHEDMDALGLARPDVEPRATEHIGLMVEDIARLVELGYAYEADGDVYYHVPAFKEYGALSGRNLEEMQAGKRIQVDERKRSPLDFVLWKSSKPGEPAWDSPFGPGRPGWHLECSTMSNQHLGAAFDIHGGGHDLIFPHHENEVAQSAPLGRAFARYWLHNGFVRVDREKMSKSLGNFFTIKEVTQRFSPEVLRLFVISHHYRGPIDFSDEALTEAEKGLDRAYRALSKAQELAGPLETGQPLDGRAQNLWEGFIAAMEDDMNTSRALGQVFEAVRELNRALDEPEPQAVEIRPLQAALVQMGRVLGILGQDPAAYLAARDGQALAGAGLSTEEIEALIEQRASARARKDWAEADRIRDELKGKGIVLEDEGGQTTWRRD